MRVPRGLKRVATLCILKDPARASFLLLKRYKEPHKNLFCPVGGKLDPHEGPRAAAKREIFEETGLSPGHLKYCGVMTETSPVEYNWTCYVYMSELESRITPPPCDEGILEWIDFDDIESRRVQIPQTDPFVYKYVLAGKPFAFDVEYDAELNVTSMVEGLENVTLC